LTIKQQFYRQWPSIPIEYALNRLKEEQPFFGIKCPEGVVLASEENTEALEKTSHSLKIFQIDDHVGAAIVGLGSDARVLIQKAREDAQSNKLTYDEPADVETITKSGSDLQQVYTQHGGGRPFGTALIIGGVDKTGPRVFCTHPSGTYKAYKAVSLGAGRETVQAQLTENYKENMTLEEALKLAVKCLKNSLQSRQMPVKLTVAVIPAATKKIKLLTEEETESLIKEAQ
jgi:proteasome alpha subunit